MRSGGQPFLRRLRHEIHHPDEHTQEGCHEYRCAHAARYAPRMQCLNRSGENQSKEQGEGDRNECGVSDSSTPMAPATSSLTDVTLGLGLFFGILIPANRSLPTKGGPAARRPATGCCYFSGYLEPSLRFMSEFLFCERSSSERPPVCWPLPRLRPPWSC
jgi:hypothetical protein